MEPDFELLMNLIFDKSVQDEFIHECREVGIKLDSLKEEENDTKTETGSSY